METKAEVLENLKKNPRFYNCGQQVPKANCAHCGKAFEKIHTHVGRQKYCSTECRKKGYYIENRFSEPRRVIPSKGIQYVTNLTGEPSPVLTCPCSTKYIQTRVGQKRCLFCINAHTPRKSTPLATYTF